MEEKDQEQYDLVLGYFESSLMHPAWVNFRKDAQEDFEFYEGTQWTSAEIQELTDRGQPPTVENEIKPIIDKIDGQYTQQRTRISFVGRNMEQDEETGQVLSDLALYVQQQTDFEYEEKDSFVDGIKCGFGVIETGVKLDEQYPKVVLKYEDCLNVYPDPYSKRYDWSDANFVHRTKWVNLSDAKNLYPGKINELMSSKNADPVTSHITSFKKDNYFDDKNQRIRLIETWYKKREKKQSMVIGGEIVDITKSSKKKIGALKKENPDHQIIERDTVSIKMVVWCAGGILESSDSPYEHGLFPFIPFFASRKKDGEPMGVIRALKSVQMEINKRRSKALHLLSTNRAITEEGGVKSIDMLREQMARPDGVIEHRKGYEFSTETNVELAQSQMQLLEESKQAIKRIAGADQGVRQEIRSNQQLQRKQAAEDIVIVSIFDNLRRTRKLLARQLYSLIKQYFKDEMVFNITDSLQATKRVALTSGHIAQLKELTFDVNVADMPETTTIQNEQFTMIADFLKSVNMPPNMSMAMMPILVRLSQLRDKKEILETLEAMKQPPPEEVKISLSMSWDTLDPMEKAKLAEKMGMPDLAQFEMQEGREPSYLVKERAGIKKQEIKSEGDIKKTLAGKDDPEVERQKAEMEIALKEREHRQKMAQSDQQHRQKMEQGAENTYQKMQAQEMSTRQKMVQGEYSHRQNMQHTEEAAKIKRASMAPKPGGKK